MTLSFNVTGRPTPSVTWEHNGSGEISMSVRCRVVELSGGVTSLTLLDLRKTDAGVYKCTAQNNLGCKSASCLLKVLGKGTVG